MSAKSVLHLRTSWGDIADVHLSNFNYIESKKDFDYFLLHASNDCYVRQGVESYLGKYRAGFHRRYINEHSKWCMAEPAGRDEDLKQISRLSHSAGRIVASQVEGSFYRRDIMQQIVQVLAGCSYDKKTLSYTREEFYFSTAAFGMLTEEEIGYPVVFSEVHRFDRSYYKYLKFSGFVWRGRKSAAKQAADQFVLKAMHRLKWGALRKKDVQAVRRQNNGRLKKNQYLDDGIGKFRLYDTEGLFAVKRVPRDMRSRLRKYIRTLPIQEKGV